MEHKIWDKRSWGDGTCEGMNSEGKCKLFISARAKLFFFLVICIPSCSLCYLINFACQYRTPRQDLINQIWDPKSLRPRGLPITQVKIFPTSSSLKAEKCQHYHRNSDLGLLCFDKASMIEQAGGKKIGRLDQ